MTAIQPWAKAGGRALSVLAVLWLAWVAAGLVWLASGHSAARLLPPPQAAARAQVPAVDVARLAAFNLFGAAPLVPAKGVAADAPDTSLQLRLSGVFVNADPERSSAIIAERNNPAAPAKVYRINEAMPGGAVLQEVYDDRILIRRGAASEVLRFEKTSLLGGQAPAMPAPPPGMRELLGNAAQVMESAPEAFVDQMGLRPGDNGYEVTDMTPQNMREAVGLQPGDKLVSINGRRLGNPQRDRGVLNDLQAGGRVKVEVQRGGQTLTLERKF